MNSLESFPIKLMLVDLEGKKVLAILGIVYRGEHLDIVVKEGGSLLDIHLLLHDLGEVLLHLRVDLLDVGLFVLEPQHFLVLLGVVVLLGKLLEEVVEVLLEVVYVFVEVLAGRSVQLAVQEAVEVFGLVEVLLHLQTLLDLLVDQNGLLHHVENQVEEEKLGVQDFLPLHQLPDRLDGLEEKDDFVLLVQVPQVNFVRLDSFRLFVLGLVQFDNLVSFWNGRFTSFDNLTVRFAALCVVFSEKGLVVEGVKLDFYVRGLVSKEGVFKELLPLNPVFGLELEDPREQVLALGGDRLERVVQFVPGLFNVLEDFPWVGAEKRVPPEEDLIENHSDAPKVCLGGVAAVRILEVVIKQFGSGSERTAHLGLGDFDPLFGHAEIPYFDDIVVHEQVGHFEVAMNDLVFAQFPKTVPHLTHVEESLLFQEKALVLGLHPKLEVLIVAVVNDEVDVFWGLEDVVEMDDIRVLNFLHYVNLGLKEFFQVHIVFVDVFGHALYRVQFVVLLILGQVHHSLLSLAQFLLHFERSYFFLH